MNRPELGGREVAGDRAAGGLARPSYNNREAWRGRQITHVDRDQLLLAHVRCLRQNHLARAIQALNILNMALTIEAIITLNDRVIVYLDSGYDIDTALEYIIRGIRPEPARPVAVGVPARGRDGRVGGPQLYRPPVGTPARGGTWVRDDRLFRPGAGEPARGRR